MARPKEPDNVEALQCRYDKIFSVPKFRKFGPFICLVSEVGKVCIRAKWPIRPELIPVSVA